MQFQIEIYNVRRYLKQDHSTFSNIILFVYTDLLSIFKSLREIEIIFRSMRHEFLRSLFLLFQSNSNGISASVEKIQQWKSIDRSRENTRSFICQTRFDARRTWTIVHLETIFC